ncbi:MAG: sulfotransferase domain-containing protein [Gemmatimonadota bacterium]|nr:MAG: sulfotransferase domain-containing protein [Gemmatimonadota bacterium]
MLRSALRTIMSVDNEYRMRQMVWRTLPVAHRSRFTNIFHTCNHKTASQWVRIVLSDHLVYRRSGLLPQVNRGSAYVPRERCFKTFPEGTIVTPLYIHYQNFCQLEKPAEYAAFFVSRDPRDIVTSLYFSNRYSHPRNPEVSQLRRTLSQMSMEEGLLYTIDALDDTGQFDSMRSWAAAARNDSRVKILKYEDLTGADGSQSFRKLFEHCDIAMERKIIERLLRRYRFERFSGGRAKGDTRVKSKYRRGLPGDWANHFTASVVSAFQQTAGDLLDKLAYA